MAILSGVISLEQVQEIQLRVRVRELTNRIRNVEAEAERISQDPNRSPSPPPVYDDSGNRTNTRAMRMHRALDMERTELIEEILNLNPSLRVRVVVDPHTPDTPPLQVSAQSLHSPGRAPDLQLRGPNPGSPRQVAPRVGGTHPHQDHHPRKGLEPRREGEHRRDWAQRTAARDYHGRRA